MKIVKKVLVYFFGVFVASALCVWLRPGGLLTAVFYGVFAFALPRLVSKRLDESDAAKPVEYVRELQKRKARESSAEKPDAFAAPPPELHYHACPECGQLTPYLQTRCDCGHVFSSRPPVDRRAVYILSAACVFLLIISVCLYLDKSRAELALADAQALYAHAQQELVSANSRVLDAEARWSDAAQKNIVLNQELLQARGDAANSWNDGYSAGYSAGRSGLLNLNETGGRFGQSPLVLPSQSGG